MTWLRRCLPVSSDTEMVIDCARCGRHMIAQAPDATPVNDAMEICSTCAWDFVASAWDEGFAAAEISKPSSRKGHWEDSRVKGLRTWIPDPIPTNPYRAVVAGKGQKA